VHTLNCELICRLLFVSLKSMLFAGPLAPLIYVTSQVLPGAVPELTAAAFAASVAGVALQLSVAVPPPTRGDQVVPPLNVVMSYHAFRPWLSATTMTAPDAPLPPALMLEPELQLQEEPPPPPPPPTRALPPTAPYQPEPAPPLPKPVEFLPHEGYEATG
jgi:hypothetical protein